MAHTMPSQHDAEEQLRPYLGRLFEAREAFTGCDPMDAEKWQDCCNEEANALDAALTKALDLLGVQR